MPIQTFRVDNQTRRLHSVDSSAESLGDVLSWTDLEDDDRSRMTKQLSRLGFDDSALDLIRDPPAAAHITVHERVVVFRFAALDGQGQRSAITLLIEDQRLITVHDVALPALGVFSARFERVPLNATGLAALVFELLDAVADETIAEILAVRDRVDAIEQSVDTDPEHCDPEETRRVRRRIVELEAILEDQHHGLTGLQTLGHARFGDTFSRALGRDSLSHIEHAIRVTGRLADRLSAVQTHYSLTLAERQNQKLNVLAILSAVFLPLTLITGIYGMNFEYMPELSSPYGYPVVLLVLVSIAAGLLWFLRRQGWFR